MYEKKLIFEVVYMYKLIHQDNVEFNYCSQCKNGIPTPFEIISEDEWRTLRHRWHNPYCDFNTIYNKEQLLKLFNTDDGRAEAYIDYNEDYAVAEVIKKIWENNSMKELVVYVKIGCHHSWEYVEGDNISYVQKCKKCGTVRELPTGA